VGTISPLNLCDYRTKVYQTFSPIAEGIAVQNVNVRFWISLSNSGDICRQTLKSSEIRPNFACFWPLFFWGEGSPKL